MCSRYHDEPGKRVWDAVSTPPVFAELLFRMIDELSDDIVSWSVPGDSVIIKKVLVLEGLLPSYYSHSNFASFVRQLNNYGFRRIKRPPSSRLSFADGGMQRGAAATPATRELPWEEFSHPLFRRGRRDLLVGITRHKDGAPISADLEELGELNSLRAEVSALSGDLQAAKAKLESIMSLLSDVAGGQSQTTHSSTNDGATVSGGGGGGGGGGSGLEYGGVVGAKAGPAEGVHGGGVGFWGWTGGGSGGDGGIRRGGQDWSVRGAPPGYFVGHQQQGAGNHVPPQTPWSTEQYPVGPHQVPYVEAPPPLGEGVASRASESASTGPSHGQLPPQQYQPPPHVDEPSSDRGPPFC